MAQGLIRTRLPTPRPWAATSSDPSERCWVPISPARVAAMGSTIPRFSGTASSSSGPTHRNGAPMEKISLVTPTTS